MWFFRLNGISNKFYVAYAEEFEGGFSIILIDAKEDAIDRFNILHKEGDINYIRTFNRFIKRDDYKNCVGVFMDFANPNPPRIPKNFIKMHKDEIIINAFNDEEKIILFKTNDKLIISVYGKLIYSNDTIDDAKKALPIDEIYEISNDSYELLFKAMAKHTIKRIITLID